MPFGDLRPVCRLLLHVLEAEAHRTDIPAAKGALAIPTDRCPSLPRPGGIVWRMAIHVERNVVFHVLAYYLNPSFFESRKNMKKGDGI